jgi:hypothetical protein
MSGGLTGALSRVSRPALGLTRTENLNIFTTRPASDPVAVELEP